jgi:poly-gamma-glutamate capsule biosynthesis protein CapA/YwtB (metallophosphatase superfamily)
VGDIAMVASSDGGAGFFSSSIRHELRGDVVVGNLEGTLATGGVSKCGPSSTDCFAFRAPPSYGRLLRQAGFTLMNVANNHAYDYGSEGERETLAALRSNGLRYTGLPGQIALVRTGGVRVALIGFAPYPWAQSLTDIAAARRIVQKARRQADLVVVIVHAGAEGSDQQHVHAGTEWFLGENRGNVKAFGHAVVDAGADLVLGSGPHVLRGMEWYHGRLIAYSLGNFLGDGTLGIGGVLGASGILHVTLRPDGGWVRGDLAPVRLVSPGLPALDPAEEAHGIVRTLSRDDFGRNAMRVTTVGQLLPPAWRTG